MTRYLQIPPGLPGDELHDWLREQGETVKRKPGRPKGWYAKRGQEKLRRAQLQMVPLDNAKARPSVKRAATPARLLPKGTTHA